MGDQRYTHPTALARMAEGNCPECGQPVGVHRANSLFWLPGIPCSLTVAGVQDRIEQFEADIDAESVQRVEGLLDNLRPDGRVP
jgi:hypothetical protein